MKKVICERDPAAFFEKPGEECGVFALYSPGGDCAMDAYYALYALQHRGQESCGIVTNKGGGLSGHKDLGTVGEVFTEEKLRELGGTMAIGHVRYATEENGQRENNQPLVLSYAKNKLAAALNGCLTNAPQLKERFEKQGAIFHTDSDAELAAYSIARETAAHGSLEEGVRRTMALLKGAYCLVVMSEDKLLAARDPFGFRPLCIGRRGADIVIASESCALDGVNACLERDVEPGELVVVEKGKLRSVRACPSAGSNICVFEFVYFARPDSVIDGQGVHNARLESGRLLARQSPVEADIVMGVPDSGLDAAMGYAQESGISYTEGFLKNRYISRTFIKPKAADRLAALKLKLSPLRSQLEGKRIVLIDDSIVRGTTSELLVGLLRSAGARDIHMRIASPPFVAPCYFGTDVPDRSHLIACRLSKEEIRRRIGCDSLDYLSVENLRRMTPELKRGICEGCFTAEYPYEI